MEKSMNSDVRSRYLEGLRNYKKQGVIIKIDGKEEPEEQWNKIFTVAESSKNGAEFYMADYIAGTHSGKIKEIRLDKIRIHDLDEKR